jgi:poly-beta-1,6-N-acetyl-D-glucosamine synthase
LKGFLSFIEKQMISGFILGITFLYSAGVWLLWRGWQKTPIFENNIISSQIEDKKVVISVIVPVRNEAQNILNLLDSLLRQDFPIACFEVIVVDDYSEDNTSLIVNHFQAQHAYFPLSFLKFTEDKNRSNKKVAISHAVLMAKGGLIVTTDADCSMGAKWLSTIYGFYQQFQPQLISSPVALDYPPHIFGKMQVVEFASLVGSGVATLFWGYPTMCNGANMAYTKEVFLEVGGFEGNIEILTGDDEFLMQKVYQKYPKQVLFLKSQDAIVRTPTLLSFEAFYQQRKRWASKWSKHKSVHIYVIAILIFTYHLLNLCAFCLLFFLPTNHNILILFHFLLKLGVEFVFLTTVHNFLNSGKYWFYILPLQFMYSLYVVLMGIAANFGVYEWKGRKSSKLSK